MLGTEQNQQQAERLMEHLKILCNQIGPRPATSREERRAAEYIRQYLETTGIDDIRDQFFTSPDSLGWTFLPTWMLGISSGMFDGKFGKLFGGVRLLFAAKSLRDALLNKQPSYISLLAQGASQNVIARIAPSGDVRRRVFLVANLDTSKHRNSLPVGIPGLTRPLYTATLGLLAAAGLSMIVDDLRGKRDKNKLQLLASAVSAVGMGMWLWDATQPYVEGANDNASSVAALLALGAQLHAQPLAHTEVTLLFTGCAEAGAVGIENYLDQYAPPRYNSTFINLEMVGAGRLGYVAQHGASLFSTYRPSPQITVTAAQVARDNPALRVNGVDLPLVDEMASIVARGYEAITIAGYDDHEEPSHWHRASDMIAGIEADTLVRATDYTAKLLQALDSKAASE